MKMWGGRFEREPEKDVFGFTRSIDFDILLLKADAIGTMAHAKQLSRIGVISQVEESAILKALHELIDDFELGRLEIDPNLEDVHSLVEKRLVEECGEAGLKVHTGRSRNDQVALDLRMYLKARTWDLLVALNALLAELLSIAAKTRDYIFAEMTHFQPAQPSYFGHHILAYCEMIKRDFAAGMGVFESCDVLPLGSGACAGIPYPIDREELARELRFAKVTDNSADAVSDRDFALEFVFFCARIMMHLSRMCEELIIFANPAFGYLTLSEETATGSSIMPQKKNPDVFELIRAKSARVFGDLGSLFGVLKALPLTYNRDLQEDKPAVFDSFMQTISSLNAFRKAVSGLSFDRSAMEKLAEAGYSGATALADYLVEKGVPFRRAHQIVGRVVSLAEKKGVKLQELPLSELKQISASFEVDAYDRLEPRTIAQSRNVRGGTSQGQMELQIEALKEVIQTQEMHISQLRERMVYV